MEHYIIVKLKDKVDWRSLTGEFEELFSRAEEIDGVYRVQEFQSVSLLSTRFHYMIKLSCSERGLENFLASSVHREWKERYGDLFEQKAIFDCGSPATESQA